MRSFVSIPHGRIINSHAIPARLVLGPAAFHILDQSISQSSIRECSPYHNLVVSTARAIGVKLFGLDAAGD